MATNDEAHNLNERVRKPADRSEGRSTTRPPAPVSDGLPIGVGDVIATRKNDSNLGVANRQTWTVQHVGPDGALTVVEAAKAGKHHRSIALPSPYVAEHVHLAYATPPMASKASPPPPRTPCCRNRWTQPGVYVGMTRGRNINVLHIVAENLADAREQFADAMERRPRRPRPARRNPHAQAAVAGLVADGPVKVVNDERARLARPSPRPSGSGPLGARRRPADRTSRDTRSSGGIRPTGPRRSRSIPGGGTRRRSPPTTRSRHCRWTELPRRT